MPKLHGPVPTEEDRSGSQGHWFGPAERPLLGWLTVPAAGSGPSGVLVLPDIGPQYWSAHGTLRALAERLARDGHTVLRLDYDGTGDSAGEQTDPDRVAAWRASVRAGAAELRALGCPRLTVVGLRLGAMLALLESRALGAAEVVAWSPPLSGRRHARALRLLGEAMPDELGFTTSGVVFSADTLADLSALDLTQRSEAPAPRVLLVGEGLGPLQEQLQEAGSEVALTNPPSDVALSTATEDAEVAEQVVSDIAAWVTAAPPVEPRGLRPRAGTELTWQGQVITEQVVTMNGLVGVQTESASSREAPFTVVFLNAGSTSHVGQGRAWVEIARALAVAGHRALRVDWRGFGESPDEGRAPGRPYDRHTLDETVGLVQTLSDAGHRVVLVGLCASGWMAMRVAELAPVAGVMALNPQLYWTWGDPVLSQVDTGVERTKKRLREEQGRRLHLWGLLDVLGQRPPAARWLSRLSAAKIPVLLLYSEGDDGLGYLRNRLARRVVRVQREGWLHVQEVPGIDHGMNRAWLRPLMVQAMLDHLERVR
jgi:pimeloyl-ACP methyl ester carboxylesterase